MENGGTRVIGMIGGVSWESSALLYRLINQETRKRLGGNSNARSLMFTVDFAEIVALQHRGDWDSIAELLGGIGRRLESAGAECLMLCANALHKVAPQVQSAIGIPLLHIGDATGHAIRNERLKRVGLLGTRTTMEQPFLRDFLLEQHGIETIVPDTEERSAIQHIIFEELAQGLVLDTSRDKLVAIVEGLERIGCEGIVLGCTELPLLFEGITEVSGLPLFNTTALFASYAVDWALRV